MPSYIGHPTLGMPNVDIFNIFVSESSQLYMKNAQCQFAQFKQNNVAQGHWAFLIFLVLQFPMFLLVIFWPNVPNVGAPNIGQCPIIGRYHVYSQVTKRLRNISMGISE
jgi:hypothetical protein